MSPKGTDHESLPSEEENEDQPDRSDQHESPPAKPPRKLKVPKFLTEKEHVEPRPDPATTFRGHEQPPANERLEQIKIFLADEDANRCLDFKDKLKQIQEYLAHIEKHQISCDKNLFKDAKVMSDIQADWHDRMDKSALGDPLCVDTPQIQPYSTRLMSNEVTLAIRETKEINGTQAQIREDRPPFTVKRTKDHAVFIRAIKEDAKKTLMDLTEEEENRNLFKIESHAYFDAKRDPALIPLWTDPIRGIADTGKTQSSPDPWYGNGQVLGVAPEGESGREPKHSDLPVVVRGYQEAVRYYLNEYRENIISLGRGDLRHAKEWSVAVLKGFLRLFPTPEAKALERNANVYSTGQRKGNMTDEEYRAVKDDWKKYNDLQDQLLEHLSAKTTPQIQFFYDEPDMVKNDIYDPTKVNITREYAERMREVYSMQKELHDLMRECRDSKGPQSCNWWILGRMAEILSPVEPDIFGEVGQHWAQFKTRHIPLLWDKAFDAPSKRSWLVSRSVADRAVIDPYIQRLRDLWTTIFENEPELQREEGDIEGGKPWIVLLPLQKGALRTDPIRHKMPPKFLQPYIFYVPWATPKPELSPELEKQLERIHRLLKAKSEQGGRLSHIGMAALRQNLAPFYYPRLRRMYDQTLSENKNVREKALEAFAKILDPWLAGFEGVGIEIRGYKPANKQALLTATIPAALVDAPDARKAPQLRQRDPSVLYQTHRILDPDALNTLNAQLNKDIPDDGDVVHGGTRGEGWDQKQKNSYASLLGSPALQKIEEELDKVEDELNNLKADEASIVHAGLQKEWALIKQRLDEEERRTVIGVKAAANSKLKDKTIKVLQSVDLVDTDVDTDNLPGVFYLATEPPSPVASHHTKADNLSLVPNLDTGLHRNREQNWQQFILGYPQKASHYDTGALNFQAKAERRGIQRAAIEMALNLLASNYEQRRPDDRFRRVVIPSPWQKPLPEVPISLELEPTKRPVELDTKYYTKLMVEYTRWKDEEWYDAREKVIKATPGQLPPPANFNGPFTIPTMFEYQDAAAKYLGNLTPTWNALLYAAKTYPRPFLRAVLARIERGVRFEPGRGFDILYEKENGMEIRLTLQELGVLRELTEPSWNCHWLPYPPVTDEKEDVPRQILDEFERDVEALPESEKPPYWVSEKGPNAPPIGSYPMNQWDIRTIETYDPNVKTTQFVPMLQLLQHINNRRSKQNLPAWDRAIARSHFITMHKYHHIHSQPELEAGFELDRVARVALTGHPEMKYIEDRRRALNGYGIQWDEATNTYSVQYNAARFMGPPIIQPNMYSFIEKASFKFGRAIAMYTEELTLDERHYTRELSLDIVHQSYSDTMKRLEGKELYPGEPNVPPANPNPNNINLIRIASDLYKVAPDIFSKCGLNPETLLDASIPYSTRLQYSALVIQSQVIEELNNNWESRFPVKENVWGFARDRMIDPVRTVVAGRTFTEYYKPRQYFSMRRWPPCEQSLAGQSVIKASGPIVQTKVSKELVKRKTNEEKRMELLRKKQEPIHIGGAPPNFPFGETPYQQAYQSWRITEDLKDVPEFNPPPKPKSLLAKVLPNPSPLPPIDRFALPRIPPSFRPKSMPVEILRQKTIAAARSMPGLPNLAEYYREDNEIKAIRDYQQWQRENERIKRIEELAKGKSWQSMTREEREKYEGELAVIEIEKQRALQDAGGWDITGSGLKGRRENGGRNAGDRGLVLRTGHGGRKRNRSGSAGGREDRKKRDSRPTPIQSELFMSGAL